jgi:N-formylglutamate deformylase
VSVRVHEPTAPAVPVVASIPHGGEAIPPEVRALLAVSADELPNHDWHLPLLYDFLPTLGVTVVEATASRYVADVNRDPAVPFGQWKSAVVPDTTTRGVALYTERPHDAELQRRIETVHTPYHVALRAALGRWPRALLLDLHAFGGPPVGDVVLGDSHGTTASDETTALVEIAFATAGFAVVRNTPYAGGWITRSYASEIVEALQVELNYRCYCDPSEVDVLVRPRPGPHLDAARARLRPVFERLVGELAALQP